MLQLLYTNAPKFNYPQPAAPLSHGGWVSSSEIPNGYLGNIFGGISTYTIQQNLPETRVIAVKNIGGDKQNMLLYVDYPENNDAIIKLAVADVQADDCGDLFVPKLQSIYSIPFLSNGAVLVEADGILNALSLGEIQAGAYFAVYIQRVLKDSLKEPKSDDDLLAIFDGTLALPVVEDMHVVFQWDD